MSVRDAAATGSSETSGHQRELAELRSQVDEVLAADASGSSATLAAQQAAVQLAVAETLAAHLDSMLADDRRETETTIADARELHRLACRLMKEGTVGRLQAADRVERAIGRVADSGPPSELIARAPAEAADALALDRVVLSRLEGGSLLADAIHCGEGAGDATSLLARLQLAPVQLEYPLAEAELARRRVAQLFTPGLDTDVARHAFADVMRWGCYLAAPIVLEGRVIGFLHGDRLRSEPAPGPVERDGLGQFAESFGLIFERAVLRQRLRIQRQELRDVASWADARTSELSDSAIDLAVDRAAAGGEETLRGPSSESRLRDLLTKRELDVAEHLVTGKSNAEIARALVVSPGTVKFHVKNILRKLNASNRAEATSRYLRLSMQGRDGSGSPGPLR